MRQLTLAIALCLPVAAFAAESDAQKTTEDAATTASQNESKRPSITLFAPQAKSDVDAAPAAESDTQKTTKEAAATASQNEPKGASVTLFAPQAKSDVDAAPRNKPSITIAPVKSKPADKND